MGNRSKIHITNFFNSTFLAAARSRTDILSSQQQLSMHVRYDCGQLFFFMKYVMTNEQPSTKNSTNNVHLILLLGVSPPIQQPIGKSIIITQRDYELCTRLALCLKLTL
eukprot:TRINITY_DN203_c0_g1_i7.p3 TRINITY_DN203_c0_g1~~TRINITY_DN203_c0_g1_i7.p3  ORF type:complete len:109 (-),score=0.65 TRINITY_DN203_c0_g1_i7:10-336(-)